MKFIKVISISIFVSFVFCSSMLSIWYFLEAIFEFKINSLFLSMLFFQPALFLYVMNDLL